MDEWLIAKYVSRYECSEKSIKWFGRDQVLNKIRGMSLLIFDLAEYVPLMMTDPNHEHSVMALHGPAIFAWQLFRPRDTSSEHRLCPRNKIRRRRAAEQGSGGHPHPVIPVLRPHTLEHLVPGVNPRRV